ncbi:hypothetical protein SAMN05661091_5855 [Paenibacillus uliginis N3/975]|uniref:Uncharacterized protein n=1 Tax=Paenibacillus uliginis N3/975 TaxID=1313296 RepID=A0A1X7HTL1_9BACL|nr:hypothetical protein SAMN05661091_5855 [Paenibacillus uliginis N3/975]
MTGAKRLTSNHRVYRQKEPGSRLLFVVAVLFGWYGFTFVYYGALYICYNLGR